MPNEEVKEILGLPVIVDPKAPKDTITLANEGDARLLRAALVSTEPQPMGAGDPRSASTPGTDSKKNASPEGVEEAKKPERLYVASRASLPDRPAMWRRLRDQGAPIVSSWIDEAGEEETASFSELWARIEAEIRSSARLILYVEAEDLPLKGALIEVGMALAMGKPVTVVAPGITLEPRTFKPIGSWTHHPLVSFAESVELALSPSEEAKNSTPEDGGAMVREIEQWLELKKGLAEGDHEWDLICRLPDRAVIRFHNETPSRQIRAQVRGMMREYAKHHTTTLRQQLEEALNTIQERNEMYEGMLERADELRESQLKQVAEALEGVIRESDRNTDTYMKAKAALKHYREGQ